MRYMVALMMIAGLILAGCSGPRYTVENVWPPEIDGGEWDIAVEWPKEVTPGDIYITTVDGYTITVAPVPESVIVGENPNIQY